MVWTACRAKADGAERVPRTRASERAVKAPVRNLELDGNMSTPRSSPERGF